MPSIFRKHSRLIVALFFAIVLLTGLLTFDDYYYTCDEALQREHSIINYQYVLQTLFHHELRVIDMDLETYQHRLYGVAVQLPMVFVEHLRHFSIPLRDVFVMRHLYTFLLCYSGYLAFYVFLKRVFGRRWLALLGTVMMMVYPRFWGDQFNNIKDMVFMATICWSLLSISFCLSRESKWRYEALAGVAFAFASNSRIVGMMMPAMLLGYRLLRLFWLDAGAHSPQEKTRELTRCLCQPFFFCVAFYLITPAAWAHPLAYLTDTLTRFSDFSIWPGGYSLLGKYYLGTNTPWFYLPVWLGLSLPLWYLVLLAASLPTVALSLREEARRIVPKQSWLRLLLDGRYKYWLLSVVMIAFSIGFAILRHSVLYSGWRHMYYLMPGMIVMMLFPLEALERRLAVSGSRWAARACCAMLCAFLGLEVSWNIRCHPTEYVYFNPIGMRYADGMAHDYWLASQYPLFQYVLARDPSNEICVSCRNLPYFVWYYYLTPEEQARITMTEEGGSREEYIFRTFAETVNAPLPEDIADDYTLIYVYRNADLPLSLAFLRNDVLQERFGGQYPQ